MQMRIVLGLLAAGLVTAARADGDSKINFHTSIRSANGSRIEVTGSFRLQGPPDPESVCLPEPARRQ